ncbi:MAG: hypothetical protein R3291_01235, partial [Thermoplasmata archaeon]|nr:hypothetical protein [Thermoplasmata archaeon]
AWRNVAIARKQAARYIVGIDLGTTHTVTAYADTRARKTTREIQIFEIEQLVAPGAVAGRKMLPSFCYRPAAGELRPEDLVLVPAFNEFSGGTPMNERGRRYLGPILKSKMVNMARAQIYLLNGTYLGRLGGMMVDPGRSKDAPPPPSGTT